ncbi:exodeoxyribonuclease V subunit beta [Desulfofustis limnaeus]|uniref:DNA 3'-5' helicase n=1 Tax=Desulfofustis limnaeus TaxID=2740163 RepID=A0ABM7W7B3_9BACT|nr:exodeoxyribonuclease V subunit beta [Desulfofustis limnaeus]BDD86783.1 RecBCD enzyme subunit RecB [Desulfofustis limnaeus]
MTDRAVFNPFATRIDRGINLIEASAGTGKTFSIAMLVLRGIVELGLAIDRILVVTYTKAATEELRERVRLRLAAAAQMLETDGGGRDSDADLYRWLNQAGDQGQLRRRIELALLDIDRAPIQTIHSFCQTILQEQALAGGQPFDLEVVADIAPIREQLVEDFWRTTMYPLSGRYARLLCASFADPASLYQSIAGADHVLCTLLPEDLTVAAAYAQVDRQLLRLCEWWQTFGEPLAERIAEAETAGHLKKAAAASLPKLVVDVTRILTADQAPAQTDVAGLQTEELLRGLNGKVLRTAEKKQQVLDSWPLPGPLVDDYLAAVRQLLCAMRLELARFLRAGLTERLLQRGMVGFDHLVTSLADAVSGAAGGRLCRQVGKRYDMALIDEFQDTDSAQWLIFSRLFGGSAHYLYLIGDPKQAIYRFRGADIHSYYQARQQADRLLTLQYNYRTQPGLMAAINRLLAGVSIDGLDYHPVHPARTEQDGRLLEDGRDGAGLVYCLLDGAPSPSGWPREAAGEAIRAWVVDEAARLLDQGDHLPAVQIDSASGVRALRPEDIAVLVRSNREAIAYQDRFRRFGIPAVITSRRSVFQSEECREMLLVAEAVARPTDLAALRTALSCDWFGLDGQQHYRLCRQQEQVAVIQQRFHGYLQRWREHGFLPMFSELVRVEQVLLHLADRPGAHRRLANIQHLAELVQEQHRLHLSVEQTVAWLSQASTGTEPVEEAELRLESDARALQIVTMHSAKGLEFPIVFCPSLLTPAHLDTNLPLVFTHDEQGRRICDLGSERFIQHALQALEEEEQEAMRLAYVAITRAVFRCYLVWAEIQPHGPRPSSFAAPLGRLLFAAGPVDAAAQLERLAKLGRGPACAFHRIGELRETVVPRLAPAATTPLVGPRRMQRRSWQPVRARTSFSALTLLAENQPGETRPGGGDELRGGGQQSEGPGLPAGVRFGSLVHEIFERFAFADLATGAVHRETLETLCRAYGLTLDPATLLGFLHQWVRTPLLAPVDTAETFALADLDPRRLIRELPFTLSVDSSSTRKISELLAGDPACVSLSARELGGYLTGFIDLVVWHGGKYYVIDYKTNHLGEDLPYDAETVMAAMRAHNYGLQYWLYTVVVHRFLRRWLSGYSYRSHFGGVLYPFVRGMRIEHPGGSVYHSVPDPAVVEQLDRELAAR